VAYSKARFFLRVRVVFFPSFSFGEMKREMFVRVAAVLPSGTSNKKNGTSSM